MARPSTTMPNARAPSPVDNRMKEKAKRDNDARPATPSVPVARDDAYSGPTPPPPAMATTVSPTGRVIRPAQSLTTPPVPGVTHHTKKGK